MSFLQHAQSGFGGAVVCVKQGIRRPSPDSEYMCVVGATNPQVRQAVDVIVRVFDPLIQVNESAGKELCLLETLFQIQGLFDFMVVYHAFLYKGGAEFTDISGIVNAVVMQFFENAELALWVFIEFAPETIVVFFTYKGKVSCATAD